MSIKMGSVRGKFTILFLFLALAKLTSPKRMYARHSVDLQNLERFETQVVDQLIQKISTTKSQSAKMSTIAAMIDSYVKDFKEVRGLSSSTLNITNNEETPASKNPICAYRMLRRIQTTLQDLVSNGTFQQEFSKLAKQITSFSRVNGWPDETDVEQIIMANLRIQAEYNLKTEELANGWIYKIQTHCTLNSDHCEEFAKIAYETRQYAFAIEWLELAREKCSDNDKTETRDVLDSTLKEYIQKHNENIDAEFGWKARTFNRKIRHNIPGDSKSARSKRDVLYKSFKNRREAKYREIAFWGLCSGDDLQTEREKAHLFCWQEFKIHPSFTIGPVKMEFLSRNPDLVQLYELFNENDMKVLKLGTKMIGFSTDKHQPPHLGAENYRTSVNSWYRGSQEKYLTEKVSRIMGLNHVDPITQTSEAFQVASYSPGRFSAPHLDVLPDTGVDGEIPNRIATLMVYLNDVDQGGSTAFTSLGVAVKPAKGSSVFWYNTFSDGIPDSATLHGACPLILGEKWVSNKWIHFNGQFRARKCGLKPRERFRVPVNNVYLPIPKVFKRGFIGEYPAQPPPSADPTMLTKYSYISPYGLRSLAELDEVLYLEIRNIYKKYKNKNWDWSQNAEKYSKIKAYLKDYEDSVLKANSIFGRGPHLISKNPLAAFKLILRFIDTIQNLVQEPDFGDELLRKISSRIGRLYNTSDGPTTTDVDTVVSSILHIQFNYNLNAEDIAVGMLDGVDLGVKLNPDDCFNIGNVGIKFKYYSSGIEWLELGLRLMERNNNSLGHSTNSFEDFQDALISAQVSHDEEYLNNNWHDLPKMFSRPLSEVSEPTERIAIKSIQYEDPKYENNSRTRLSRACSTKLPQVKSGPEKLICWYEREIHPIYKIGPVKVELFAEEKVEIVQFHDILSDDDINSLINLAINHPLTIPAIGNISNGEDLQRLNSHLLTEDDSAAVKQTLRLGKTLSGLDLKCQAMWNSLSVAACTPGGFAGEHTDGNMIKNLDLIATFMPYLSDVEQGGETVFTSTGIKIIPKRGSALFWYNRFSCGKMNDWTTHGGCPVIFGEKWVALWWPICDVQNQLQCHLKPETPYDILMNGKSKFK